VHLVPGKQLQCIDLHLVKRYNDAVEKKLLEHENFNLAQQLRQSICGARLACSQQQEYESIDQTLIAAILMAE